MVTKKELEPTISEGMLGGSISQGNFWVLLQIIITNHSHKYFKLDNKNNKFRGKLFLLPQHISMILQFKGCEFN